MVAMRLTKGSTVEVLIHKDDATGAYTWRRAEVISGNGHTYFLKYFQYQTDSSVIEWFPKKAIRPLPPPLDDLDNWWFGDVIEVFHYDSWKTGQLVNKIDEKYFSVRLLGTASVFKEDTSCIRIPHGWDKDNEEWFIMGHTGFDFSISNQDSSTDDDFSNMVNEDRTKSYDQGIISCASSGGSCDPNENINGSRTVNELDDQDYCSDAESSWSGPKLIKKEAGHSVPRAESHTLELYKYGRVLEELYATRRSLSWEEELQLTDLRGALNISSDEHLIMIRRLLASAGNNRISIY